MKIRFLTFVFLLSSFILKGQVDHFPSGAVSRSLADADVAVLNRWSGFGNPAGMAFLSDISAGIYIENRFNIRELYAGAMTINLRRFNVNFYSFNQSTIYNRQKFGLAYALLLTKSFSAGIELDLIRTAAEEYGTSFGFCGEAGLLYIPEKKLTLGVHIFNPSLSKYHGAGNEKIPTTMRIGAEYKMNKNSFVVFEASNSSWSGFGFHGGAGYDFTDRFSLRAGFMSNPVAMSFGLGFRTGRMSVDIALIYQQVLDSTPGLSLDYIFRENKNSLLP